MQQNTPKETPNESCPEPPEPARYLSAKATHPNGQPLTPAEIEAAEAEAEAWARRVNSC